MSELTHAEWEALDAVLPRFLGESWSSEVKAARAALDRIKPGPDLGELVNEWLAHDPGSHVALHDGLLAAGHTPGNGRGLLVGNRSYKAEANRVVAVAEPYPS